MLYQIPKTREEVREYVARFTGFPGDDDNPKASDYGFNDPRIQYGLTDADIHFFKRHDVELKAAIDKYTGMDFPVHTIDDFLIVEFAGMLQKLGADGAIAQVKNLPRRLRALIRAVCRNHKTAKESLCPPQQSRLQP